MSKIGQEFEKSLDNAKYDLYEACRKAWLWFEIHEVCKAGEEIQEQLYRAIAKVEGK